MANSSLVPNTTLLGHTNFQKAKFEKFGSEEANVALCVCLHYNGTLARKKNFVWSRKSQCVT